MDWVDRTQNMFQQTNDDLETLLKITANLSKTLKTKPELQEQAILQMNKILADAEAIGEKFALQVKKVQSELDAYLDKPSEKARVKVMQDTMNIKHKVREI